MKKSHVVALLVVAFVMGMMAGGIGFAWTTRDEQGLSVSIKGRTLTEAPPVMINDRVYVPIRFVAENLDCKVEWENNTVYVNPVLKRPPINGDKEFVDTVNEALNLLQEKDPAHYAMVCQNVDKIVYEGKDQKNTLAYQHQHYIYMLPRLHNNNQKFVPMFLAGVLVHEAAHSTYLKSVDAVTGVK